MKLLQTSYFLPSLLATYSAFLRFLSAAAPILHSSFISPSSFHLIFLQQPSTISPSAALSFICMAERKGCSRASRALLCPSRPRLRFVMLDNARQCRDKTADKKSLVFFCFFPLLIALLAWGRRILQGRFFRIGQKKKKNVPLTLINVLVIKYILCKANSKFPKPCCREQMSAVPGVSMKSSRRAKALDLCLSFRLFIISCRLLL